MQRLIVVLRDLEHLGVGLESHGRAGAVGLTDDGHLLRDVTAGELHLVDLAVFVNLDLQPFGKGVDHARADAVQAAGDLVAPAAELAARVEHREHDLQRALARLRLDIHGDAAAVVTDADDVARLDRDLDVVTEAGERLVDGVVHDLIHQMVQTGRRGRADIHARALAHRLQALEDLNLTGVITFRALDVLFRNVCHKSTSFA